MNQLLTDSVAAGYSAPSNYEKNDKLCERIYNGDDTAIAEMVESNMAIVTWKVNELLTRCPHFSFYRDDLLSVGLGTLTIKVRGFRKQKVNRPTRYLIRAIEEEIRNAIDEESTIRVPARAQRHALKEGKPIKVPKAVSETRANVTFSKLQAPDEMAAIDMKDEIYACCLDATDQQIVDMRIDGYMDHEIAKTLGTTQQRVSERRQAMEVRFLERCPEYKRD